MSRIDRRSPFVIATGRPEYQFMLKQLKLAREEAGMTQIGVSEALGRRQNYVSKCETGDRRMDPIELAEFAQLYRKPYDYFIDEKLGILRARKRTRG